MRLQFSRMLVISLAISFSVPFLSTLQPFGFHHDLFVSTAEAATIPPYSIDQLTTFADAIAVATVISVEPKMGGRYVVTDTKMKIQRSLKGDLPSEITLRQRGGRLKDFATIVPGMPTYRVNEQVLVFLEKKNSGNYVTAGLWQGKYVITTHQGTPMIHVTPVFFPPLAPVATIPSQSLPHSDTHVPTRASGSSTHGTPIPTNSQHDLHDHDDQSAIHRSSDRRPIALALVIKRIEHVIFKQKTAVKQ